MFANYSGKTFNGFLFVIKMSAVCALVASGTLSARAQSISAGQSPAVNLNTNYRIGPGDVLDVIVSKNDALSKTGVRVNDLGNIQLPMLEDEVQAACLTERQLALNVKEKYRKFLVNPYVNVSVSAFNSNPVALIGAVQTPGRFQLQRQMRVLELLALVNGPSPKAGRSIEIVRTNNRAVCDGEMLVAQMPSSDDLITLPLTETLKGTESANPYVRSGDIIRVVEADETNAYIQGNVKNATVIKLQDTTTLSQAVAMAGGLASGADASRVNVRRLIPNSINRKEIIVDLKAINLGKQPDFLLIPNDIIEVPGPTGGKKILRGIMDRLLPAVTSLPTRVIPF